MFDDELDLAASRRIDATTTGTVRSESERAGH
jgi:hypothetical protein